MGSSATELKAFKKRYRASLDELRLSAEDADALVEEANTSFLMNMLLFEERDVAAGHLSRVRGLEEVQALVKANKSALNFQRAYAEGAAQKCPFLPAPGKSSTEQRCPWPFVWLHDPQAALVRYPAKNLAGVLSAWGLARLAKRFPRSVAVALLAAAFASFALRPKSAKDASRKLIA